MKTIKVLGTTISEKNFPVMTSWAKTNLQGLENTIRSMQEKDHGSVETMLVTLENEFGNDNS